MSNKTYDFIRFLSEIAISAIGALYYAIASIWGLPYGDQIVATCAALSTFLGIFTEWQRTKYNNFLASNFEVNPDAPVADYSEIKENE